MRQERENRTGIVKSFNPVRGLGYIIPDEGGGDVLFSRDNCEIVQLSMIWAGRRVTYQARTCPRGERAVVVRLDEPGHCPCCGQPIKTRAKP